MNTYAREIGVLKDKDPNFTGADIRNGMTAVVSIKHPAPDSRVRPRPSLTTRTRQELPVKLWENSLCFSLTEILRH